MRSCTSASCAASASNLFGAVTNGRPVSSAIFFGDALRVLRVGVEPGADRRAAERELVQLRQRRARCAAMRVVELRDVAGELLAERERRGVLQVRPADLDDVGERRRAWRRACRAASVSAGQQRGARRALRGGDAASPSGTCRSRTATCSRRRSGGSGFFEPSSPPSISIARFAMHLVDVHVRLRAAAGLPDDEREVVVEASLDHLVGGLHDSVRLRLVEHPEVRRSPGRTRPSRCRARG